MGAPTDGEAADRRRASRSSATSRGPGGSRRRSPGILLAPVFLLLARRVLATERAALFATLLLLLDGVYLVQSRIAMTNIFAVLFQLLSALLLLRAVLEERLRLGAMALAGLALGLALSTRWTSLWAWGFLGLVFLAVRGRRAFRPRGAGARSARRSWSLPAAVYLLSYVPWMRQGNCPGGRAAGRLRAGGRQKQRDIWSYHANLTATHTYFSPWWTWPWLYRPTWYFWFSGEGFVRGIVALGNPAIWWASVPVSLWALGDRNPLARPAARLLRRRLLPALPAVGPLAAHAQLLPLPLRGHPLRLPVARDAARPPLGQGPGRRSRAATWCWWRRSSCCSCPS